MIPTKSVIGLPVGVIDYDQAVAQINTWAKEGDLRLVEAANTHVASLARHDAEFGEVMAKFDLICPDGMPLIWSINAQLADDEKLTDRVYGPTLMWRTLESSTEAQRHFLLGGTEKTLTALQAKIADELPQANIVGAFSPPFRDLSDDELDEIFEKIAHSGANVVWVCFGCPKQEKWVARHKDQLPPAVYLTVGAAFAFHAGEVRQAPAFIQKLGLEWCFRLAMEPRRLFRRYLVHNSLFVYYSVRDRFKGSA